MLFLAVIPSRQGTGPPSWFLPGSISAGEDGVELGLAGGRTSLGALATAWGGWGMDAPLCFRS